jgi:hypothetical protein
LVLRKTSASNEAGLKPPVTCGTKDVKVWRQHLGAIRHCIEFVCTDLGFLKTRCSQNVSTQVDVEAAHVFFCRTAARWEVFPPWLECLFEYGLEVMFAHKVCGTSGHTFFAATNPVVLDEKLFLAMITYIYPEVLGRWRFLCCDWLEVIHLW